MDAAVVDPLAEFLVLFERARVATETSDPTAFSLATADPSGRPSVRIVLLKTADSRGFVFYTNYGSRKAQELDANPRASLCFHWPALEVQVRAEGSVARVSAEESDAYFASRPRESQIGAWASRQSTPLESADALLARFREMEARFAGQTVPRPEFWGGYLLSPERIEFWHGRPYRLHERLVYTGRPGAWTVERLYP